MSYYVRMVDEFMSGWGEAKGCRNILVIRCDTQEQAQQIETAARRRPEMKQIRVRDSAPIPSGTDLYNWKEWDELSGSWKE